MNRLLSFLEYRPRLRNILSFCFSLIVMLLIGVGKVTAQDLNNSTVDLVANLWMLIAGSLVFFMNAGFALLETGFCRTNNATNVLANQLTFAGTAATIVSGAVAERVKFWAFLLFSFFLVAFSYSLTGHWIWSSEGWLYNLFKFRDFAGSTVVHSVGGMAGLVGAWLLKPRDGRFGYNRKTDRYEAKERGNFAPHQLGFATLGCFILWLGWFGFNGGSAVNLNDVPITITTTMIAAATGGFLALIFNPLIGRKASLSTIINGILGGLVGITASSGYVNIRSAIIIGGISGIIVLLGEEFLIKTKVIDDPVGAIPVHLFCGFWGTIAVGLFSSKDAGEFANGLTQDSPISQVAFQFFGWIVVMAFTFIFSLILWLIIGNLLHYMQVIVLRQKNPQVNSSPVVRSQSFNLPDLFSLFWSRGREGIRVSLSEELTGSDGVFSD